MVIQCKNLISLYILPDQRRVNLIVFYKSWCHLQTAYYFISQKKFQPRLYGLCVCVEKMTKTTFTINQFLIMTSFQTTKKWSY